MLAERSNPHHRYITGHGGSTTADQWRALFQRHRDALSAVASILTDQACSPSFVLFNAEFKLQDKAVAAEFQLRYAIRTVVLVSLGVRLLEGCPDGIELFDCKTRELMDFREMLEALPLQERAVLFLRDVLEYSRRETALLLKTSDSQIEDLLTTGRGRLLREGAVSIDRIRQHFAPQGTSRSLAVQIQSSQGVQIVYEYMVSRVRNLRRTS
jgi:Sigma-70, region 4